MTASTSAQRPSRALSPVLSPPCAATRQHIFRNRCGYLDLPVSASHEDAEVYKDRFNLKVGALNALLDELVVAGGSGYGRAAKASAQGSGTAAATKADVLGRMMRSTTPKQMRWIVQIILGNLKARCKSTSLFNTCLHDRQCSCAHQTLACVPRDAATL